MIVVLLSIRSSLTMLVPIAAQGHQHMVIDSAMRDIIDKKMNAAVAWASSGSHVGGLPLLTSNSVKRVFLAPAWSNRGGPDVRQPGLRAVSCCYVNTLTPLI